jgi:hypothetical protein
VKRLWVEPLRERLDLLFVDRVRAAKKSLSDVQVFEAEEFLTYCPMAELAAV